MYLPIRIHSVFSILVSHTVSSMTQLLSHTFAHLTGSSFMLKANNQPYKKLGIEKKVYMKAPADGG